MRRNDALRVSDLIPFAPLAAPSHFWFGWPDGAWYEGEIAVPVHLYSRAGHLARPNLYITQTGTDSTRGGYAINAADSTESILRTHVGVALTFTPRFVVRQLSSNSAPVRSPSFNPTLDLSLYTALITNPFYMGARPRTFAWVGGLHFKAAHYSNGQSGCLSTSAVLLPSGACVPGNLPIHPDSINTEDGSFSTHYVEAGISGSYQLFNNDNAEELGLYVLSAIRWNPPGLAGIGGMDDVLAEAYGRVSFPHSLQIRTPFPLGKWFLEPSLRYDGELALGRGDGFGRTRSAVTLSVTSPDLYGFGLALRYASGWDYYNTAFGQDLSSPDIGGIVTFGIIIDHARRLQLRQQNPR